MNEDMEAQKSQVAAKWQESQESFQRLNADAPGIARLRSFSEVSRLYNHIDVNI